MFFFDLLPIYYLTNESTDKIMLLNGLGQQKSDWIEQNSIQSGKP